MPGLYEDSTLAAAAHILTKGPLSRADMARDLRLSPGTLTRLVRPLIEDGLVLDDGMGISRTGMGRPTQLLRIPSDAHAFIGINLTSTMIHAVVVDVRAVNRVEHSCPIADRSPAALSAQVNRLIEDLADSPRLEGRLEGVGISMGGSIDAGVVKDSRFLGWKDVDLASMIRTPEGTALQVVNDLEAQTWLEQWFGLGVSTESFILVTVGAGIGHGVVHGRRALRSPAAGHGVTGHFPVAGAGGMCQYGHAGCANGALTVPAVVGRARAGRSIVVDDGRPWDQEDLMALATEGDQACRRTIAEFARNLATYVQAVASACLVTDVVLDGEGVGLLQSPWARGFEADLEAWTNPHVPALNLHRRSGTFLTWARGASVASIIAWLEGRVARL